jgi:hypothetical protein
MLLSYERPFLNIVAVPFMALLMLYLIFCLFQAYIDIAGDLILVLFMRE